jgi:hypothetical protein
VKLGIISPPKNELVTPTSQAAILGVKKAQKQATKRVSLPFSAHAEISPKLTPENKHLLIGFKERASEGGNF